MTNSMEQRWFDTIRAAAARDLQPDDPYAYHFSSDTYEEETLQEQDSTAYPSILEKSGVEQAQIDATAAAAAAAADGGEISAKAEKQQEADDVIVVRGGSTPDDRRSKSSSDVEMDNNTNSKMEAVDDPTDVTTKKDDEKTNHHPAATKMVHQGEEEMMTNSIAAGKISGTTNGPFGLPVYAWGLIGVAAGLILLVVGAMIAKRRGRKTSKTKRFRECGDESAANQHHRTGTKKRVAIDYGGEGDDVDVEELSVVSNISSLSGGTFVVRHDRV